MPDREKVINEAFDEAITEVWNDDDYFDIGYNNGLEEGRQIAIALLKGQDAVEPKRDANCVRMFRCGSCGEYVGFIDSDPGDPNEHDNYCRNCGRKVQWE